MYCKNCFKISCVVTLQEVFDLCTSIFFLLSSCVYVLYSHVYLCTACVSVPREAKQGRQISWKWCKVSSEPPCGYWKRKLVPLEEQATD